MLRDRVALLLRLAEQSRHNPGTHEVVVEELASLRRDVESIEGLLHHALIEDRVGTATATLRPNMIPI